MTVAKHRRDSRPRWTRTPRTRYSRGHLDCDRSTSCLTSGKLRPAPGHQTGQRDPFGGGRDRRSIMRKQIGGVVLGAALAWMLVVAGQAAAISRGVPDGEGHPMVAALGEATPDGVFQGCGATLVS